jgi:nucleoside-diphosphate-sugar epimerase
MRVVVIGGTGHVGTYLIPRLVALAHEVICVSRQQHQPYSDDPAWAKVQHCIVDRDEAERQGEFGKMIAALEPEVVIDLICFTLDSVQQLVSAIEGKVQHFLHCGTIWVHGHGCEIPITEAAPRNPMGDYGINKARIEAYLLERVRETGFPATIVHPGHIVGPGWVPLNPQGNFSLEVFVLLAKGEPLALPNFGAETLHHVHADDVAQVFECAMAHRSVSVGESFHAVSPAALSLRGYATAVAEYFKQPLQLDLLPWSQWQKKVSREDADDSWEHLRRSHCCEITKAQKLIGYRPGYTSLTAIEQSLDLLVEQGQL